MKSKKSPMDVLSGKGNEKISDAGFKMMAAFMRFIDLLTNYSGSNIKKLNLQSGQTVIDYGCGPARYIRDASIIVGKTGKVLATDIHPLAIKMAEEKIKKYKLSNVETFLARGYSSDIPGESADVVYALDMFHMIENPGELISELCRLAKPDGRIIIEDGHQPRAETRAKIEESGAVHITRETRSYVECKKRIS